MDTIDDCLDVDIDGGTEVLFDVGEDNPVKEDEWAEVDIILSRQKCELILISELLYPTKSRINVVLSLRVGVSRVLRHMDSSTDTTGHDDGWW